MKRVKSKNFKNKKFTRKFGSLHLSVFQFRSSAGVLLFKVVRLRVLVFSELVVEHDG